MVNYPQYKSQPRFQAVARQPMWFGMSELKKWQKVHGYRKTKLLNYGQNWKEWNNARTLKEVAWWPRWMIYFLKSICKEKHTVYTVKAGPLYGHPLNPGISIKRTVCLSLWKESPNLFSKLNPLYTDTSPSVSLFAGFDCIWTVPRDRSNVLKNGY